MIKQLIQDLAASLSILTVGILTGAALGIGMAELGPVLEMILF